MRGYYSRAGTIQSEGTNTVNCLQTCEHMSAHWAIKVYVFVKFHIHIY